MAPPVSLISTVLNEASSIGRFLDSILTQSRLPDEVVIVDGGSIDGTRELIERRMKEPEGHRIRLVVDATCNRTSSAGPIARGRNRAIREAKYALIVCADAGCCLDPHWLDRIAAPFADPTVTIVGGWYFPTMSNFFQRTLSVSWIQSPDELDAGTFVPSSRSVAFRKHVWEEVGGYPEHSLYGEDTLFIVRIRARGHRVKLVRNALVEWQIPSNARAFARLVFRYGFGDGFNRVVPRNAILNACKVALAGGFIIAGVVHHWAWVVALPVLAGLFVLRNKSHLLFSISTIRLLPFVGLARLLTDASYVSGYLAGRMTVQHPVIRQDS